MNERTFYYYTNGVGIVLETGMFLKNSYGTVYQVRAKYPSIGGTTYPKATLEHLRSGEKYTWNLNEMRYHRLQIIDQEEVPLALLGE